MTTEYASLDAIVADICKAYFRPLHTKSTGSEYNTSLDYSDSNKDFANILNGEGVCTIFFIKTRYITENVKDAYKEQGIEYFLTYFYSKNQDNSFKYNAVSTDSTDSTGCRIIGKISINEQGKYVFTNTGDFPKLTITYSSQQSNLEEIGIVTLVNFVFDLENETAQYSLQYYLKDENLGLSASGINTTFTPMDPNTTFGLVGTGLTESARIEYFYNKYDDNQSPAVANSTIYAGKTEGKTYTCLLQSVNDTIPLDNTLISSGFSAIVVVYDEMNYPHSLYMKITDVSTPDNQGISTWTGSMTEYGCPISQKVSLYYNTSNKKILFTYVNGYYENNWLGYSIDVYFITGKKIDNASSGSMLPLLYETKTLSKGDRSYYMDSASQVARGFYGSYSQFDHLYPLTTDGTVTDDTSNTVVTGYRVYNGNNTMYRFTDTTVDCSYNNTSNGITPLNILESNLTETIEDTEYSDVNIRYISGVGDYGLLPADITGITTSTRVYFDSALSDLIFKWDKRYCDLEYFVDNSSTTLTMTENGMSIKGGNTPFFCTMKVRSVFVSYCFTESQMIPSVTGSASIVSPATFVGTAVTDPSDYTLVKYNAAFLTEGDQTGTATIIASTDEKNIASVLTKANYKNTMVYIQIGCENVDADEATGKVYFDTVAGLDETTGEDEEGNPVTTYKRKKFYGYLVVYTDSSTTSGSVKLRFVRNTSYGLEMVHEFECVVDETSTSAFKADDTNSGFSITFGENAITVVGYQEFFPANMALSNSTLVGDTTSVRNTISNYVIMAVYTKGSTPSPTPSTTTSSISTYSNMCYLEDGEYSTSIFDSNLASLISNSHNLIEEGQINWLKYKNLYISYILSATSFKSRLFTVRYTIEKNDEDGKYYMKKVTMYKYGNKGETTLEEFQSVLVNRVVTIEYTLDDETTTSTYPEDDPASVASSILNLDIAVKYTGDDYIIDTTTIPENFWYNYMSGSPSSTIISIIGVEN